MKQISVVLIGWGRMVCRHTLICWRPRHRAHPRGVGSNVLSQKE
jgi:hypothetical protein